MTVRDDSPGAPSGEELDLTLVRLRARALQLIDNGVCLLGMTGMGGKKLRAVA